MKKFMDFDPVLKEYEIKEKKKLGNILIIATIGITIAVISLFILL